MDLRIVLLLLNLLILINARPQLDPGSRPAENEPKISITEVENEVSDDIDYSLLGDPSVCGYSSKDIGRIAPGGGQAQRRDWPWMAAILRKIDNFHFCGGVLITPKHILTAAHCTHNLKKEDLLIRLGEYDFSRENDTETKDFLIAEFRDHEDFDISTYENDISIIVLRERVRYNMNVLPVCLPQKSEDFTNRTAVVAGWGAVFHGGPMSDVLLEVTVPVWEQELCVDSFTQTIFDTVQCAASHDGGKDSCQGDSGGPLLTQRDDGRFITMGIVSWGIGCGNKGQPGVYTRVSMFLDWIAPRIQDV